MKYFIVTIDTEGDNLWQWDKKSPISTENTLFLRRFQILCEQYGFKPVWLTNYEMINDPRYVDFIIDVEERGVGELGMHLHAWNTPPYYDLPIKQTGLPYLIEFPENIMRKKIETMTNLLEQKSGFRPTSHRAGRWSINECYFKILKELGYTVDCSVTPHQNWHFSPGQTEINGTDFSNFPEQQYWIDEDKTLLEVPVSIRTSHRCVLPEKITPKEIARTIRDTVKGFSQWLRPNGRNEQHLLQFIDRINDSDTDYIMFMLHSSEMMPGGSPTFKTNDSIDALFATIERVFAKASTNFEGVTLRDYYRLHNNI